MTDLALITLAELVDDLERVRIEIENRIGALTRTFGSSLPHLDVLAEQLRAVEHQADLELRRAWRTHPLAPWAKDIPGAGERLMARLVATIGDPADRPNPAKLWAYCGHGDPARSRISKGASQAELFARGKPEAKKRVWLLANQFVRTSSSPYRAVYDEARARYADRVHEGECKRCGPSGKPAQPGSPWSLAHQHAAALRYVGKRFLLDLWKEAHRGIMYLTQGRSRLASCLPNQMASSLSPGSKNAGSTAKAGSAISVTTPTGGSQTLCSSGPLAADPPIQESPPERQCRSSQSSVSIAEIRASSTRRSCATGARNDERRTNRSPNGTDGHRFRTPRLGSPAPRGDV